MLSRGSHGSGRADFPHPALHAAASSRLRGIRITPQLSPALDSCASLSRHARQWLVSSMPLPSRLSPGSACHGSSFPPRGPSGRFPRFISYYELLRLLVAHCALSGRLPPCLASFPSLGATAFGGDDKISQVPGEPLRTCSVLRPRQELRARPFGRCPTHRLDAVASANSEDVGSCHYANFGAQSRSLHARCLRFAARVALCRHARLATGGGPPYRDGTFTRWVPS